MRVRFGQERFRETNAALNAAFAEKKVLVAAHRGSWGGNILQNTRAAYTAALRLGADMVESDTSATSDGVVYSFHNGYERLVLGVEGKDISEMTSAQVDALCPRNVLYEQCSRRLDRLDDVLRHLCHGELINIDRIWRCPDRVLEVLDRHPAARMQCVIKAPPREKEVYRMLERHPVRYMFMPVCRTRAEIDEALSFRDLNAVGVEMIAASPGDELFGGDAVRFVHGRGLYAWANAITLGDVTMKPLYGGLDDDLSVLDDPAGGWGRLVDMGFDVIQTDWPELLRRYLRQRGIRA